VRHRTPWARGRFHFCALLPSPPYSPFVLLHITSHSFDTHSALCLHTFPTHSWNSPFLHRALTPSCLFITYAAATLRWKDVQDVGSLPRLYNLYPVTLAHILRCFFPCLPSAALRHLCLSHICTRAVLSFVLIQQHHKTGHFISPYHAFSRRTTLPCKHPCTRHSEIIAPLHYACGHGRPRPALLSLRENGVSWLRREGE